VALGADVVGGDGDLAVGLLAQRAAVLLLDADGVSPLLGEGDVVEEEVALGAGESLRQVGTVAAEDVGLVPGALVDDLLQGLPGSLAVQAVGQGAAAGERLDALAFVVEQQPLQVDAGPQGGLGLREVGGVVAQAVEGRRVGFGSLGLHAR
jgi:hypothetical protein